MFFRNPINAAIASVSAIASGLNTALAYLEPAVGILIALIGGLAAYATFRAQRAKERTEHLKQQQILAQIKAADED